MIGFGREVINNAKAHVRNLETKPRGESAYFSGGKGKPEKTVCLTYLRKIDGRMEGTTSKISSRV